MVGEYQLLVFVDSLHEIDSFLFATDDTSLNFGVKCSSKGCILLRLNVAKKGKVGKREKIYSFVMIIISLESVLQYTSAKSETTL